MSIKIKFLGTAQDAGIPQIGCNCEMCKSIKEKKEEARLPVSLGVYTTKNKKKYLFDATPALTEQYDRLQSLDKSSDSIDGIFITHAHIGHYTGLFYLGKEALNTKEIKVFVSKKMREFLENNAPWNQLVERKNIVLIEFENEVPIKIEENFEVIPVEFPHRNEYADTYGFIIKGEESVLFLPDIDAWDEVYDKMNDIFSKCRYAIIDATFFSKEEIGLKRGRDLREIPHPSITDTIQSIKENRLNPKNCKIIFTHFNHTNMILTDENLKKELEKEGYIFSEENQILEIK